MKNLNLVVFSLLSIMLFTSCNKLEDIFGNKNGNEEESILENLPDYCDIQTIDGWSNVRFCKKGIVIFTKNFDGTQQINKALMFVPSENCGITAIYGEYDEVGMPKYLSFDDAVVFIEDYKDGKVNLSLIQGEDYMWGDEGIEIDSNTKAVSTRAWNENNWVRNTCAIGGAITSAIGIGAGVAITGSGVGAAGGLLMIGASSKALADNLEVLFGPGDDGNFEISDYAVDKLQNIGMETMVDMLTKNEKSYLKTLWPDKFNFKKGLPDTPNTFWIDFALEMVDAKWGKTVTEATKRRAFIIAHLGYQIVTGRADEITEHTARLYGYISPEAMYPLGKFAEVEYGIVVYQTDNEEKRIAIEDITGQASTFNLHFRGLDYNTEYTYFTYYYDKTNAAFRQGELKTFKTQGEDELRDLLIEFYNSTGGDNWHCNDNWCSNKPLNEWYGINQDSLGYVVSIDLSNNNLTGSAKISFDDFSNLSSFNIDNNKIKEVYIQGNDNINEITLTNCATDYIRFDNFTKVSISCETLNSLSGECDVLNVSNCDFGDNHTPFSGISVKDATIYNCKMHSCGLSSEILTFESSSTYDTWYCNTSKRLNIINSYCSTICGGDFNDRTIINLQNATLWRSNWDEESRVTLTCTITGAGWGDLFR